MSTSAGTTLNEAASKALLAEFGLPVLDERLVATADEAAEAARSLGGRCVAKLCGDAIAHKTERNLVRLGLDGAEQVHSAATELLAQARPDDGEVGVLVAPMVSATREFIVGGQRSDEFGPVVMLGVGGIFAEVVADVVFRLVPAPRAELASMLDDLTTQALLGPFRGEPAIDRDGLVDAIEAVAAALVADPTIESIDVNPVLITEGRSIAVDALVARR